MSIAHDCYPTSKPSVSTVLFGFQGINLFKNLFFHFALLEKEWKLFIFTFHFSNFKNPLSLVPGRHGHKKHEVKKGDKIKVEESERGE